MSKERFSHLWFSDFPDDCIDKVVMQIDNHQRGCPSWNELFGHCVEGVPFKCEKSKNDQDQVVEDQMPEGVLFGGVIV